MDKTELHESKVIIKASFCTKCYGWVRLCVKHKMNLKMRNDFITEVFNHNLTVKEMPLIEYKNFKADHCVCD